MCSCALRWVGWNISFWLGAMANQFTSLTICQQSFCNDVNTLCMLRKVNIVSPGWPHKVPLTRIYDDIFVIVEPICCTNNLVSGALRRHATDVTSLQCFPGCLDGWTLHGDMCYKRSMNEVIGDQAKLECEAMEAVLASVRDEEAARFIMDLLNGWVLTVNTAAVFVLVHRWSLIMMH